MCFFKVGEAFFKGREEGFSDSWVGLRFVSKEEGKWRYFGGMVRGCVMLEFSSGEKVGPGSGIIGAKDVEVGFNFLVGWFSLSITLWVISCGESDIVMEELGKFLGKGRNELWASIGDLDVMEAKSFKDMIKESFATPAASMVLLQGIRITPLLSPWSTTTIKESYLLDFGKLVMRSMEICLKGNRVLKEWS